VDVPPIRSARLELVSMSAAFLEALLDERRNDAEALLRGSLPVAWPDEHDGSFLRLRLDQMRDRPDARRWSARALVRREDRVMVGHAGFHGEPGVNGPRRSGALEVGYTVFPNYRGHGYATEAVAALMDWARRHGVEHFVASVAPDNEPSLAIVRKLGFLQTGDQWDEDEGLELVFELGHD
jgi:ribosomal-protein-alanine N-acetyltransferase